MSIVLVADDNDAIRQIIIEQLNDETDIIFQATDNEEVLDILEQQHIDLMILDNSIPSFGGLQLLNLIREPDNWPSMPMDFSQRAGRFLGVYRYASSPHTTLIKIVELFGAYRAEVSDPGDGTLLLTMSGSKRRFVEVEPLYFHQVDGSLAMVFREDDRGRITRMYTDFMPWYATVIAGLV